MSEQLAFFASADDPLVLLERAINEALWGLDRVQGVPRELLLQLQYHKGPSNPMPLARLAQKLQAGEREIKQAAKTLREEFHLPLGANREPPWGYWLAITAEDRERAGAPLFNQAISMLRSYHAVCPHRTMLELLGQTEIELKKESA